ncbi:MAG: radical SAM protein [Candidatus Eisenbacteria bacterium]
MDLPSYVQIEPVGQCNLRCTMCPIQFRTDGPPHGPAALLPFESFTRIIDGFPALSHLHLQGLGEPLIHPRFFDMVAYASGKKIEVTTNTNMTLLSDRMAALCVSSGLSGLHVSIDGATSTTYERIRTGAHFAQVVRNVERFLAARRSSGGATPYLRVIMVAMRGNLDELPGVVRLAASWEAESLFVQHLCHDYGEGSLPPQYQRMRDFVEAETLLGEDPGRVAEQFGEAKEAADRLGLDLRLPRIQPREHPAGTPGPERCDWPWRGAYVSWSGLAMPCCMVSTPDRIHFGSVIESSARDVWNGERYEAFRRALASDVPPEVCRSCSLYKGVF